MTQQDDNSTNEYARSFQQAREQIQQQQYQIAIDNLNEVIASRERDGYVFLPKRESLCWIKKISASNE